MSEIDKINKQLVSITLAKDADFFEIKHFLKRHKQSSAKRNDRVYIVRYEKRLIGIAKLVPIVNTSSLRQYWLTGLYMEEIYRNLGLASQLLKFIYQDLSTEDALFEILAFPYHHLEQFYHQNGYQPIEPEELPKELQSRYLKAKEQQKNWLCMAQKPGQKN